MNTHHMKLMFANLVCLSLAVVLLLFYLLLAVDAPNKIGDGRHKVQVNELVRPAVD